MRDLVSGVQGEVKCNGEHQMERENLGKKGIQEARTSSRVS